MSENLNEEFNSAKATSAIVAGSGVSIGVTNVIKMNTLKKELRDLNNPTKARALYRDSGSTKLYSSWLAEKKRYANAQLKNLRYSTVGAGIGAGIGLATLAGSGMDNLDDETPSPADKEFHSKGIGGIITGTAGIGAAYSFKTLVQLKKEINKLKNNISFAKEKYKASGSKETFNKWRTAEIARLEKMAKGYTKAGVAGLAGMAYGGYKMYSDYKDFASTYNEELITESFYGKPPLMKQLEHDLFGSLIQAIANDENPHAACRQQIHDAEIALAKFFNLERIKIHIGMNYVEKNAFTVSWLQNTSSAFERNFDMEESSAGIRYKDSKDKILNVYIYPAILTGECTEGQLMGALLHEIGHNFFVTKEYVNYIKVNKVVDALLDVTLKYTIKMARGENPSYIEFVRDIRNGVIPLMAMNIALLSLPSKFVELFAKISVLLTSPSSYDIIGDKLNINLTVFYKLVSAILSALGQGVTIATSVLNPIRIIFGKVLTSCITALFKNVGSMGLTTISYQAEKYADAFAAKFGYGPELIEWLNSITEPSKNCLDIVGSLTKLYSLFNSYMGMYFVDEHPSNPARAKKILELYKKELRENYKNLDKQQQKELTDRIKEMEKLLKVSNDKHFLTNVELVMDKPYHAIRDKVNNKLPYAKGDATFK